MTIRYMGTIIEGDEPKPSIKSRLYAIGTRVIFIDYEDDPGTRIQLVSA